MYQVFVVEDELLIRQNIRRLVEKAEGPFSFCGEASDGEMALSIIQDVMPDILLTDIRMPFLDGFELIRHARAIMPWLKVIIISGFDEFEYARKAIDLGVNSFLLKPVNAQDLYRELNKLAGEIENERSRTGHSDRYDDNELDCVMRQNFIQQLFSGTADTVTLLDKAGKLKLDIIRSNYQLALFSFDCADSGWDALGGTVNRLMAEQSITTWYFGPSRMLAVLFCDNDAQQLSDRVYRFISILKHEVNSFCNAVTVVTSPVTGRLSAVSRIFQTAQDLLNKARMVSPGQVIDASDAAQLALGFFNLSKPFDEAFRRRLAHASPGEVEEILDSVLKGPDAVRLDSTMLRFYALLEILKSAAGVICAGSSELDIRDVAAGLNSECDINMASCDKEKFRATALELMNLAVKQKAEYSAMNKHNYVINRAVSYVQKNFCDPNITLISTAEHVGMSTAHFSTVFGQTMGKSFISYLTMLRMEKAKQLLLGSDLKIADVAMEVGYNEPNYFSYVFRKSEGVTPKEFRNSPSED